jgi:hypothetical protein
LKVGSPVKPCGMFPLFNELSTENVYNVRVIGGVSKGKIINIRKSQYSSNIWILFSIFAIK